MGRTWRGLSILGLTAVSLIGATTLDAQQVEQATSPFQAEFEYRIGDELRPQVSVDGVLIDLIRIAPRRAEAISEEGETDVEITWSFSNAGSRTARVLLVLLLEDEQSTSLERVELPATRVASGKTKDDTTRTSIRGRALLDTRKLYVYCELE